jgi:DNA replication initiation complex subunit (GINS family)
MILNIGAIRHCLEQYKCHSTHNGLPDDHYKESMQTLKDIQLMLIDRVSATYTRDQLIERIKHTKIQKLKDELVTKSFEDVIGKLLQDGFFPLDEECETIMSEIVGMSDTVILP